MHPIAILLIGMVTIIGAIVVLRVNAFLALIGAAMVVSLLAPGDAGEKIARVAEAFGRMAGSVGIVIALAAIIGTALMQSGAADRVVAAFLALLGERRGATALGASGFVLSIPVFFDTVFYLLIPLARSMYQRTGRHYLKYLLAVAAGGTATHALVPPTPGPLAIAGILHVDLGAMILVGVMVAMPAAVTGLFFARWVDKRMPVVPRSDTSVAAESESAEKPELPALVLSLLPILVPVLLISSNTIVTSMVAARGEEARFWSMLAPITATLGNANLALLLAAAVAIWLYVRQRRPKPGAVAGLVEKSLMSGGLIILITAAGGAFGAMLQSAQVGPAIQSLFAGRHGSGLLYIGLAFTVASLIKIAQGSSTVAMITTAGMLSAMISGTDTLPFNVVYVCTAIAGGSLVGTWMNDSGFWVFSKMGGTTEVETLKSWTPLSAVVGITALIMTVVLALLVPLS
ncbi:MAG: gluconate permease [Gemmatimonadota bacterium]|nr:MAG: gluconate permease [Gemmatimonadota bacterium]